MSVDPSKTSLGYALANSGYEMLEYTDCWAATLAWNLTIAALLNFGRLFARQVERDRLMWSALGGLLVSDRSGHDAGDEDRVR